MLHSVKKIFFLVPQKLLPVITASGYYCSRLSKTQQNYLCYTGVQANIDQWPAMLPHYEQSALQPFPAMGKGTLKPFAINHWR
jgi:hypothetical protein